MGKQDLTEQEIRSQYIRPAIVSAGWKYAEIREEYHFVADCADVSLGETLRDCKHSRRCAVFMNVNVAVVKARCNEHGCDLGLVYPLSFCTELFSKRYS